MQPLFGTRSAAAFCDTVLSDLQRATDRLSDEQILNCDLASLVTELTKDRIITFPELGEPQSHPPRRAEIIGAAALHSGLAFRSIPGRPVMGLKAIVEIPYTGSKSVFEVQPNTTGGVILPAAEIDSKALRIIWHAPGQADQAQIKSYFDQGIHAINVYLDRVRPIIEELNRRITALAQSRISERRRQITADRELVVGLGFVIKERPDPVVAENSARITLPALNAAWTAPGAPLPAPALTSERFERAVATIQRTGIMLERSPSTTRKMNEGDLRNLILLLLNDKFEFEGFVGAEVFNSSGRSDILVRVAETNVLVGECKFHNGPKSVHTTLDQVLRYLSWRDDRAVVIMFFKKPGYTKLISDAAENIANHPQCTGRIGQEDGARYDYTFHAQDDPDRTVHLVFIPFAIKQARTSDGALAPDPGPVA